VRLVRPAAYVVGVAAALSLPWWLGGKRLARLVRAPGPLRTRRGDPAGALRVAHAALRLLARTRLPWWRNTCLYRALAECLVLRRYGIPCRVELGVTRAGDTAAAIGAHAWVVRGDGEPEQAGSLAVLR
jgi:Transglutaminase-like superfamily